MGEGAAGGRKRRSREGRRRRKAPSWGVALATSGRGSAEAFAPSGDGEAAAGGVASA